MFPVPSAAKHFSNADQAAQVVFDRNIAGKHFAKGFELGHQEGPTFLDAGGDRLAQGIFFPFSSKILVMPIFLPINPDIIIIY